MRIKSKYRYQPHTPKPNEIELNLIEKKRNLIIHRFMLSGHATEAEIARKVARATEKVNIDFTAGENPPESKVHYFICSTSFCSRWNEPWAWFIPFFCWIPLALWILLNIYAAWIFCISEAKSFQGSHREILYLWIICMKCYAKSSETSQQHAKLKT